MNNGQDLLVLLWRSLRLQRLFGATCNFLANVNLADGSGGLQSWRRNPSRGCQRLEAKNETCSCFLGPLAVVLRMSDGTPEAELTCMVHHACAGSSAFQGFT